jgi:hypothetical protein
VVRKERTWWKRKKRRAFQGFICVWKGLWAVVKQRESGSNKEAIGPIMLRALSGGSTCFETTALLEAIFPFCI